MDFNLVKSMLTIETSRWINRRWQSDFIEKNNLNVNTQKIYVDYKTDIDFWILKKSHVEKLNEKLLERYLKKDAISVLDK